MNLNKEITEEFIREQHPELTDSGISSLMIHSNNRFVFYIGQFIARKDVYIRWKKNFSNPSHFRIK